MVDKFESSITIFNKARFSYVTNIEQKEWFCERKIILRFEIDFATIDTRVKRTDWNVNHDRSVDFKP